MITILEDTDLLIKELANRDYLEQEFKKNPPYLTDSPVRLRLEAGKVVVQDYISLERFENIFAQLSLRLNSQSYGNVAQHILARAFGMTEVSSNQGKGDANSEVGHIEMKVSIPREGKFSIQQVRPSRDIDFYLLALFYPKQRYSFLGFIPKEIIKSMLGSQSHGTKELSKLNHDPEFGLKNVSFVDGRMSENLTILNQFNIF